MAVKKLSTKHSKASLQEFANESLWFLYGGGQGLHSCAARALAEEMSHTTGFVSSSYDCDAQALIGFSQPNAIADDILFVIAAPKEFRKEEVPFVNRFGEEDSYENSEERIISDWYPPNGREDFLVSINLFAPRDEIFKSLRSWFWQFSKSQPQKKRRLMSPEAVILHLAIVRLDRAGFGLAEITAFLSTIALLGRVNIKKNNVRDSRKYINRALKKMRDIDSECCF
ncbi:MAG: hypothetical protein IPP19_09430 [Verrucomicrobia bacterium]|nr:hypothetical protein [Verrucomicrobiota bacterium]